MSSRDLYIGRRKTGVSVRPDPVWPQMYRIHQSERVSDLVNLTRAKDAALGWAMPRGIGDKKAHWRPMENAPGDQHGDFLSEAAE